MFTPIKKQIDYHLDRIRLYREIPAERDVVAMLAHLYDLTDDVERSVADLLTDYEEKLETLAGREPTSFTPGITADEVCCADEIHPGETLI